MNKRKLKKLLNETQSKFKVPSYSVTLFVDGEFINFNSGYRDLEKKLSASSDTLYAIGSCTKSFVAGTICSLVDQGLLGLDDCIKKHIPEFKMYDSYVSNHLTVRDILSHRSGLQRHEFSWYPRLDTLMEEDVVKTLGYLKPNQQLRNKFQYSNQMFALAGYLIKRVTGKKWQDVTRENIFKPLGITRAAFSPEDAVALGNCAVAYVPNFETRQVEVTPYADMKGMGAAGSIYMSASDLAKWDYMLSNGGKYKDKQVLSEKMCKEMITTQMAISVSVPEALKGSVHSNGYCLGLSTYVFDGHRVISHNGHIDGFYAHQFFLPDKGIACAILTNLGVISVADIMQLVVLEHCLGGKKDWTSIMYNFFVQEMTKTQDKANKLLDEKPEDSPCPVELKDICGVYSNQGYGDLEITVEEDNLAINMGAIKLIAVHYANQYFYFDYPKLLPGMKFELCINIDAQANVTGLSAGFDFETNEKINFIRK